MSLGLKLAVNPQENQSVGQHFGLSAAWPTRKLVLSCRRQSERAQAERAMSRVWLQEPETERVATSATVPYNRDHRVLSAPVLRARMVAGWWSRETIKILIYQLYKWRFHVSVFFYIALKLCKVWWGSTVRLPAPWRLSKRTEMHSHNNASEGSRKILRMRASAEKLGFSRSLIYRKLSPTDCLYDPSFPRQVKLSARAAGFLECELDAWLASRDRA